MKEEKIFDIKIFKRLLSYAKKYQTKFLIASLSAITLSIIASAVPYFMTVTINDFSTNKNGENLIFYSILLILTLTIQVILQFVFIYYSNWVGQNVVKDIRVDSFKKILSFKMMFFNKNSVGKLVTRVVSDIETIANFFTQGVFLIISDLLKMLVVIIVMFYLNWHLSLIAISILPILLYATRLFQKAIKQTFQEVRNQVTNLNSFVQERVTGMKIVQLFNREKIEYQNFKVINNKFKKANIKTIWYYSVFFPVAEILSSIAIGLIVWVWSYESLNGVYKVGTIIGFIKMTQMLFRPLRQIADKFNQLQMGIVSGERVFKILDTEEEILSIGKIDANKIEGNIKFEKVDFSYNKGEQILKSINFEVKKGNTVAIIGATGAGKSTIIKLISRFYETDAGKIEIDKVNIKNYDLKSLREQIAVVLQDVFLFSDTIFNNIRLNKSNITINQVIKSAKEIGIHDFIMSLPNQYNYVVKERGAMLSSGQRQLIAFLRAYICNPKILILDEATSSIDTYSEQMIQFATEKLTKERTSIVIAHRLATIKNSNTILVMKNGKIIEKGNHKELYINKNSYYRNLYDNQFNKTI